MGSRGGSGPRAEAGPGRRETTRGADPARQDRHSRRAARTPGPKTQAHRHESGELAASRRVWIPSAALGCSPLSRREGPSERAIPRFSARPPPGGRPWVPREAAHPAPRPRHDSPRSRTRAGLRRGVRGRLRAAGEDRGAAARELAGPARRARTRARGGGRKAVRGALRGGRTRAERPGNARARADAGSCRSGRSSQECVSACFLVGARCGLVGRLSEARRARSLRSLLPRARIGPAPNAEFDGGPPPGRKCLPRSGLRSRRGAEGVGGPAEVGRPAAAPTRPPPRRPGGVGPGGRGRPGGPGGPGARGPPAARGRGP